MAAEYFLYTTLYSNTLVKRSNISFVPLPPNTGEIFIDYFIPTTQPLYYYRESGNTIILNDDETINNYLNGTALPPEPEDNVLQYQFTGYTASTDTKINDLIQSLSGVSTGQTITTIDFHSDASANVTMSNQSSAEQFFGNNNRVIKRVNLSNALQLRLITRVVRGSTSVNNPRLILKYKTGTFSTTISDYINVGTSEISTSLTSVGISASNWINIAPSAKTDVFLTLTQIGGDGVANPVVGNTFVEIKNLVKTAESSISGVTKQEFDTYTGATDTRLDGIESDIVFISGITDTKLNTSDFNSYSGTTDVRLEGVEDDILFLSGITDSKLNTTTFNTFTGTTLPANYYNKTEINAYTGATAGQIDLKLNISDYNLYTGNTDTRLNGIDNDINFLSGITDTKLDISDFNLYSGNTDTRLNGIDNDIVLISGITDTKLNIFDFNLYSGNTDTRLNGIDDDINFLSGVTDTKLDASAFNTFTGTTLPANYYNKTQINAYTGTTQTLIGTKQNTITGAATTITSSNLTASRALVSNESGKVDVSSVTSTELGYLAGTTSAIQTQLNAKANLASPALTGTPTAPTAAVGTNTTQIATTAYYISSAANANPLVNGTVAIGSSTRFARQDHVHPVDTSRFAATGGTITGSVTINTNLTVTGVVTLGNVTPDVNQQNFAVIDNTTKKLANSGTKFHVYGSEFQYAESLGTSTTTSTTPQTKVTLTTTNLPSGLYKITGVARGRINSTSGDMIFDIAHNGSPLGTTNINIEPQDTNSYYPIVMVHFLNLSGVQTFTLRYSSETAGLTTYISDATLELIRVQ